MDTRYNIHIAYRHRTFLNRDTVDENLKYRIQILSNDLSFETPDDWYSKSPIESRERIDNRRSSVLSSSDYV